MKKNLQHLSRSVLLEEMGLPKVNRNIILIVFFLIVLFVVWASMMTINDSVSISGEVRMAGNQAGYYIDAKVYSGQVGIVSEGLKANINIAGVTEKKKISATIERVVKVPQKDNYGRTYYEVRVVPSAIQEEREHFRVKLIKGMDARVEVVTGTRNLLQYYFSRVWDARETSGN